MNITEEDAEQLQLMLNKKADQIESQRFALMFYLDEKYQAAMFWNFMALIFQDEWVDLCRDRSEGTSVLWDKLDGWVTD
jgi:hypothetical protein